MGAGFAIAGTVLVAQYQGQKNPKMVNLTASQTYLVIVVVGLLLSIVGYLATPLVIHSMGGGENVKEMAIWYLKVSMVSKTNLTVSIMD